MNRHKDQGALTVLVQDEVGGLEVRRKDGEWIGIQPRRDAFVINVGDMFQVSQGLLWSISKLNPGLPLSVVSWGMWVLFGLFFMFSNFYQLDSQNETLVLH